MRIAAAIVLFHVTSLVMAQLKPVESGVYQWKAHPVETGNDRQSRKILEGASAHLSYLEIHATTQFPGAKSSTPHANDDIEECIIVKEGTMEVNVEDRKAILGAGGVILLMPRQRHSIRNVGRTNLTYYVIRYRSKKTMDIERGMKAGGALLLNTDSLSFKPNARGGIRPYYDRPTAMNNRFEMHITQLNMRGPSHEPHAHDETEIILVISGKTEMTIDGMVYEGIEGDLYLMESQLQHGIRNVSDEPCSYFAFKWK